MFTDSIMISTMLQIVKKFLLISLLLFTSSNGFTQNDSILKFTNKYTLNLDIIGGNLVYHRDLNNGFTTRIEFGAGLGLYSEFGNQVKLASNPTLQVDLRFYPNLKNRINKGKNLDNFSGYYLSLISSYPFVHEKITNNTIFVSTATIIGFAPGIQTTFLKYGYFNFQPGIGINYLPAVNYFIIPNITGDLSLGFYFMAKKGSN
jgi:hypothetical protein